MRKILLILILFTTKSFSQKVNMEKALKVSAILCDCLSLNKQKNDNIRIEECSQALIDGLATIKDEKLRELYAQKSDTYLQRNCKDYAKIIYKNVPKSDLELVDESIFLDFEENSKINIFGTYFYKDYLDMSFNVEISNFSWREEIASTNRYINFKFNKSENLLVFEKSNDIFFDEFYSIKKNINIRYKFIKKDKLEVIFNLGNDIYLKRTLTKINKSKE